jgi:hypothetical protein
MTVPAQAGGKKYCRDEESLVLRVRSPTTLPREGPSVTDPPNRRRAALKTLRYVYVVLNEKWKGQQCEIWGLLSIRTKKIKQRYEFDGRYTTLQISVNRRTSQNNIQHYTKY